MHVMGKLVESCAPGEALFEGITSHEALDKLRFMLAAVGVENPGLYRSHDIRRGHALDLQCAGGRNVFQCACHGSMGVCFRRAALGNPCGG